MKSFQNFRQNLENLILLLCLDIYIFSFCFSEVRRNSGICKPLQKWKVERGSISNEMLFSFSSTERALSLLFGSVFEHMHLDTLTANGVYKQPSLFIDRIMQTLLVTMSNRSQDIASSEGLWSWVVFSKRRF